MYLLAKGTLGRPGDCSETFSLKLPGAVFGATAVALSFVLFRQCLGTSASALWATLLYGSAYSIWTFASVPESYLLTVCAVNLLLVVLLRQRAAPTWRWSLAAGALAAVCVLCDLRCALIVVVPCMLVLLDRELRLVRRVMLAGLVVGSAGFLSAASYQTGEALAHNKQFGVRAMVSWVPTYAAKYDSAQNLQHGRWPGYVGRVFFIETLSPLALDSEHLVGFPKACRRVHSVLCFLFVPLFGLLLICATPTVVKQVASDRAKAALVVWIVLYTLFNIVHSPWSAMLFSPPVVLPFLLVAIPAVKTLWFRHPASRYVIAWTAAAMVANNLLVTSVANWMHR